MDRSVTVSWLLASAAAGLTLADPGAAQGRQRPPQEIILRQGLVVGRIGGQGRAAVHVDPVEAQIVAGGWSAPKVGDGLMLPGGGERKWEAVTAGNEDWLQSPALSGGYCYFSVPSTVQRVMLLEAEGHNLAYVNGEPRMGDPYSTGMVRLPVRLRAGANALLCHCSRGQVKAKLVAPHSAGVLNTLDNTLPDLVVSEGVDTWGAVVVINATTTPLAGLSLTAASRGLSPTSTPLPVLPPLSARKVAFRMEGPAPRAAGRQDLELRLARSDGQRRQALDTAHLPLRVRLADQSRKRTFRSVIDGSIQYYAEMPAQPVRAGGGAPALFLTLHGAGVEAIGEVDAYEGKSWGHLVAPTNRRPYGFDWEDWGRQDAMEVLALARQRLHPDPRRIYLTGHSMGGHGVWHLGATFPDRFAAIAPSAGWISFGTYAGGAREENPTPVQAMLRRAASPGDTLTLARNYAGLGVYILHGGADDNVPVEQAREMQRQLAAFHHDFVYFEQPGAGHWWDLSPEPGADCVDWAPLFDFFARHARPEEGSVREVEFATASPGVSAWSRWAGILAQRHSLQPSTVRLRWDPGLRRFSGTTENVARLALSLDHVRPGAPLTVELDGGKLEAIPWPTTARRLWLAREGERWRITEEPSPLVKGPERCGPFKEAFGHRMLFVYGTQGTPAENQWALAKARYDAECFWYRGNGSVDLVADTAFSATAERDRSVIVYGNAETNAVWKPLLAGSPVEAHRGWLRVGERVERGDDVACLFVRPRPGSDRASVGVVGGTGIPGMRLTDRLPYFTSGVAYPDWTVLGPEVLSEGSKAVRAAGFFGSDWGVSTGDFAWRDQVEPASPVR